MNERLAAKEAIKIRQKKKVGKYIRSSGYIVLQDIRQ